MKLASVGTLGLLVLKVGQGVANTVAVVVTVGTAGLQVVPGREVRGEDQTEGLSPEGVRVGGEDVGDEDGAGGDHFVFLIVVII